MITFARHCTTTYLLNWYSTHINGYHKFSLFQGMPQKQQYHLPTSGQKVLGAPKIRYGTVFCGVELQYHFKRSNSLPALNNIPQCTIICSILLYNASQYFTGDECKHLSYKSVFHYSVILGMIIFFYVCCMHFAWLVHFRP